MGSFGRVSQGAEPGAGQSETGQEGKPIQGWVLKLGLCASGPSGKFCRKPLGSVLLKVDKGSIHLPVPICGWSKFTVGGLPPPFFILLSLPSDISPKVAHLLVIPGKVMLLVNVLDQSEILGHVQL